MGGVAGSQFCIRSTASATVGELIASETQLKGLQQIYSDDNIRVRTLKARMAELRSQLRKLVGPEGESAGPG